MGKIKHTNSELAIRNLFDNYQIVQANCVSVNGVVNFGAVTYTKLTPKKIQLNLETANLTYPYVTATDVFDFFDSLQQPERDLDTMIEQSIYDGPQTAKFSVEMSTEAIEETFKIGHLKLIVLVLQDDHGVYYKLLFSNSKHKAWLTDLMHVDLTKRNLIALVALLGQGLLYHSVGYELTTFTNRAKKVSSKIGSNQPIVSTDYDSETREYMLTLIDTSITFNQDNVKKTSSKMGLKNPNATYLVIELDNSELKINLM